jgi:L-iditol 2-dehydrogenase
VKAAIFEGIENIKVREIDKPLCKDNGMLIKVEACGICGSDIRNYHTGLREGITKQIMGHEIAGIVESVCLSVDRFKKDDRIAIAPDVHCGQCYYCQRGLVNLCLDHKMIGTHWQGGFAQYLYLPDVVLKRGIVRHLPERISFGEATIAEPASSVLAAQENANIGLGNTVLIIGDGPIGCLHIEIARARGASRIILAGLDKLKLAAQFEPDYLIDAASQNTVKEVLNITGGLGADIAIIANPVSKTQEQGIESVRKRGRVVLFGGLPGNNPNTVLNSNLIHYNELSITGAFSYTPIHHEQALQLINKGKICARKYISRTVSLDQIADGIEAVEKGEALKVIVNPWG